METKKQKNKGNLIILIIIIAFIFFAVFNIYKFKTQKTKSAKIDEKIMVNVEKSIKKNLKWILHLTGNIRAWKQVNVFSKVPGEIIKQIYVDKGDYLKKGEPIASLENETVLAKIEEAAAGVESAEARLKQAKTKRNILEKDFIRLNNLYKENAIAKQKLDHLEAELDAANENMTLAKANIKRYKATVKQLKIHLKNHTITAPISGYVSAKYIDAGSMSNPSQPIIRISEEKKLKIITTITEKEFRHIKIGIPATIKVDSFPEKSFTGNISIINPSIDPATRTGEIEIYLKNDNRVLKSGMFAKINLLLGENHATVISKDAILKLPATGNYYVFTIENSKAVQNNIKTGISQDNYVEVLDGLSPGALVVINGQNRLYEGAFVEIQNMQKNSAASREDI